MLGGLVEPNEGAVLWRGVPLSTVDADARTRGRPHDIAYVFQGSKLLPVFTAYENIAFAAFVSNAARDAECGVEGRAMEMLTLVGLAEKAEHLPSASPAARHSGSQSPARWRSSPPCFSATSRPATWTRTRPPGCSTCSTRYRSGSDFALVVATHDADIAARLSRVIELLDGRIVPETA